MNFYADGEKITMINYEQIKKANDEIKPVDVKGKLYAEVPQRVIAFRKVYPEGSIQTELVSLNNGVCTFRAIVSNNGEVLGTGTAQEKEGSTFINKTSFIENCETSAVGRALGFAGFGVLETIASAEEVQNADLNRGLTPKELKVYETLCAKHNVDPNFCFEAGHDYRDMTPASYAKAVKKLELMDK